MRDHLIKQIKEGVPVKAIAYDEGVCRSYIYSLAQRCGFAAMLVDANERRVISDMRRRAK
jgi:hypothetical protein